MPADVDPCGENGEYHTFVYDGPIFRRPVIFKVGETVYRPLLTAAPAGGASPSHVAASSIPVPATSGATATKGFWFVDLVAKRPDLNGT